MIQPYASRTGTRRNLAALSAAGWRLLVVAGAVLRTEGFRYALDNGAWGCFQRGEEFNTEAFEVAVTKLGVGADWIAAPDIVAGGAKSLRLSESWLSRLEPLAPVLIPVQDGMTTSDVAPLLGPRVGVFLGGSTEWKLSTMRDWGALCDAKGCHYHVARVNSALRIAKCQDAHADSFDGTSVTRYAKTLPLLDNAARQGWMFR